jgi:hypothetical protein
MWTILKNYFLNFLKITMGTLLIKKLYNFEISSYTFKVATTKFHENSPCF